MKRQKYPRTFHLPWSPGASADDRTHDAESLQEMFGGRQVVVTEKLDGENTTLYPDGYCHARSVDSRSHPSRDRMKALAAQVGRLLPPRPPHLRRERPGSTQHPVRPAHRFLLRVRGLCG